MNINVRCLVFVGISWLVLLTCTMTYAQSEVNSVLYDRLASETTAAALSLTDDQQASIASIIAERNIALNAAEDDGAKAGIAAEAQTKLEALLTEQQQTRLAALIEKPRIRFNFRFQKWAEVLYWVAGEAGLSLAMQEAPEGTFNYSDRREYEPDEAIDLLNGWLMIKGFTLVRRDQQLMCISLKDGIPAGTVPRIPLEDLPKRGRFEFVSVLIPLDKRDASLVMTEIKPLVSAWGDVRAMAATKQLLVTDSAEIVRNIQQVAMDVPPPRPAPGGGPKPVLTTYPVQHPNPASVVDVLKKFVGGTIVLDETASQITINAVPEQHARAVTLMKQLEENQGPDKRPELKSYPVRANNVEQMLKTLRLAVPSATLQYDSAARRLVVFANSLDHQKLTAAMLELNPQGVVGDKQLSVHPLKDIDSEVVQKLITSVLPDVRVTVDQRTSTLIAVGRLAELRAVQTLVDQLQPESANITSPVLRPYSVPSALSAMANTVIQSVVPKAAVTPDVANERLLIVAQPTDHETIAATLETLSRDVAAEGLTLRTYSLPEQVDSETFTTMLRSVAKKATVQTDAVNKRLLITASAEEHTAAERLLEQLMTGLPDSERRLRSYAMPNEVSPDTVTSMLKTLAPEASVVIDAANARILVTATDDLQQTIAATLETLSRDVAAEGLTLRTYSLPEQVDSETFTTMLRSVAKKATVQTDAVNKRLLITASAEEHTAAERLLEQLMTGLPDSERRLRSYAMPNEVSPDTVTSMLKTLAPEASVVIDAANARILVTATDDLQQKVAVVLDQLTTGTSLRRPKLKTFPLPDNVTAETVKSLLTPVTPEAIVMVDSVGKRVFVTAIQQDLDVIGPMLTQLTGDQEINKRRLKSYPLRADIQLATVTNLLNSLTPNAAITSDTAGHRLLVTATIKDHELINSAIDQITRDVRGELAQLQFYPLERVSGDYAVSVLGAIVPGITITHERETQRLSVVASQTDHQIVRQTLLKLESAAPEKQRRELRVYGVTNSQRARFNTVHQGLSDEIPGIQVLSGGEPGEMIIWAKPVHHEIVDTVLAQLDGEIPADQKPSLVVYPITTVEADGVAEILREIFPDASIKVDSRGSRLLIRARPQTQVTIKSAIRQLDTEAPEGREIRLMVYPVKGISAETAISLIKDEVPKVTVIRDQAAETLIVRGQLEEHQKVAALLDTLSSSNVDKWTSVVYSSFHSDPERLRLFFERVYPESTVIVDDNARTLTVHATKEDHVQIKKTIDELSRTDSDRGNLLELKFYSVRRDQHSTARSLLDSAVPDLDVKVSSDGTQLIALVTPDQDAKISAIVDQLVTATAGALRKTTVIYDVTGTNPQAVRRALVPITSTDDSVRITVDAASKRLYIHAFEDRHEDIRAVVDQIVSAFKQDAQTQVTVYIVADGKAGETREILTVLYPDIKIIANRHGNARTLTVVATTEDHIQIRKTIDELSQADADRKNLLELKFYRVQRDQLSTARSVVNSAVPDLDVKVSSDGTQLIALVTPEQNAKISATLDELATATAGAPRKTTVIYDVTGTDPETVRRALAPFTSTDDSVRITVDANSKRLYIHAFEDRHEDIRKAVDQITSAIRDGAQNQVAIYFVGEGNAVETQEILSVLYPDTKIITDRRRRMIIVTAAPDQQERIKVVAEQIRKAVEDGNGVIPKTYETANLDGSYVQSVVRELFSGDPDFLVSVNPANGQTVVFARPDQHERISELLVQIDVEPNAAAKIVRVFRTAPMTSATVIAALKPLVSGQTTFSTAPAGDEMVVIAPAAEQLKIVELMRQMGVLPENVEKSLATYRVAPLDARTVISALDPLVSGHVTMSPESGGRNIIISAPAEEQAKIAKLVQQMRSRRSETEGIEIQSYRLGRGQARAVISVLKPMFPDATLVTDRRAETLVATALPEEHETIAEVVKQMTGQGDETKQPVAKSYLMRQYDGSKLTELLQTTFTASDEVRINWDDYNKRIVAVARPEQQETIKAIIEELDPRDGPYSRHLEFYPVPNLDLETVNQVVDGAIRQLDPAARISKDHGSETLMVTTHERGHQLVKDTISRFTPNEPQRLRIFQLSFISPEEAYNAIDRMISRRIQDDHRRPDVHPDDNLQQLWIRATDMQLKEIEELLVQLGESGVAGGETGGSDVNLRIVPVGDDVQGAIRRIEELWPRIRDNPIRILQLEDADPQHEQDSVPGQFSVPPEKLGFAETSGSASRGKSNTGDHGPDHVVSAVNSGDAVQTSIVSDSGAVGPAITTSEELQKRDGTDPVILIPGNRRVTLASDDTDALNQLESLLRAIGVQGAGDAGNRDFSILRLKNTAAAEVSATIQQIREETDGIAYFGDIAVVAEERLNALIVYGSRTDRRRLEPLLSVLDSRHRDGTRAYQTGLLSLKYANAARIENILQSLYKTQMTAGGRRASMGIPSGVPSEVATVLRQINAAASAPLLMIETQRETNSLVIKAPADLLAEVTEFAKELDEAALTKRASGITLLPLEKSSSKRVMEILSQVLK